MLKIWGRANSANVKKVLWTAEELGVAYERVDAGGAFGVVGSPEFRAMNPNGLVPVVQDGDLTLYEWSIKEVIAHIAHYENVIVRWLAAKYGVGSLWIADPDARAKAEVWMDWSHSYAVPFRDVVFGLLRTPPEQRDHAAIARGIEACAALFGVADAALARALPVAMGVITIASGTCVRLFSASTSPMVSEAAVPDLPPLAPTKPVRFPPPRRLMRAGKT